MSRKKEKRESNESKRQGENEGIISIRHYIYIYKEKKEQREQDRGQYYNTER